MEKSVAYIEKNISVSGKYFNILAFEEASLKEQEQRIIREETVWRMKKDELWKEPAKIDRESESYSASQIPYDYAFGAFYVP